MVTLLHPIYFQNIDGQRNVTGAQEVSTPARRWLQTLFFIGQLLIFYAGSGPGSLRLRDGRVAESKL